MPSPPGAAFTFDISTTDGTCGASTIDGNFFSACDVQSPKSRDWIMYGPNGIRSGTFKGSPRLFAQPNGFIGVDGEPRQFIFLWGQGAKGDAPSGITGDAIALGPALGTGVIAIASTSGALEVHKLDEMVLEVAGMAIPGSGTPAGAAEDVSGSVLGLTATGTSVSGVWVDLSSKSAGKQFPIGTATTVAARALIDGGVAVRLDERWAGVLRPGETSLQPPPAWMGSAADIVAVRDGKAYALVPASGNRVEIVSAQGSSCGFVTFPGVGAVHLGVNGSVVGSTGTRGCTKLVWRNILR